MRRLDERLPRRKKRRSPAASLRCPGCGYNLRGLPDDHRCPECGFGYQRAAVRNLLASDRASVRAQTTDALWLASLGASVALVTLLAGLLFGAPLRKAGVFLAPICLLGIAREAYDMQANRLMSEWGAPLLRIGAWFAAGLFVLAYPPIHLLLAALLLAPRWGFCSSPARPRRRSLSRPTFALCGD